MIITVTGKIGTGKTTVAMALARAFKAELVEADKLGHEILRLPSVRQKLVKTFGRGILQGREVSRKRLGLIVFGNPNRLKQLNKIVHPLLKKKLLAKAQGKRKFIVDAALYNELKLDRLSDFTILVKAPDALIMKRLKGRYTKKQTGSILKAQKIKAKPDYIINNNGTIAVLRRKVGRITAKLK